MMVERIIKFFIAKSSIIIQTAILLTLPDFVLYASEANSQNKINVLYEDAIEREFFEETSVVGICAGEKSSELISEINGKITFICSKEGQQVSAGEPILKIDQEIAENLLNEANVKFEYAQYKFGSSKKLYEEKMLSYEKYKVAQLEFETAKRNYQEDLQKYNSMIVKAPFDGRLGIIEKKLGQTIKQGDKLFDFINDENLILIAEAPDFLFKYFENFSVKIFILDSKKAKIECKLKSFSPNISSKGTIQLKIIVPKFDSITEGTFIEANIIYNTHFAPSVSEKAIIRTDDEEFCFEIIDGQAKKISVKTGLIRGDKVELLNLEGSAMKKRIIVEGLTKIFDGDRVIESTKA